MFSLATSYLTPLALDALTYVLLARLTADGRARMQDDGVNLAKWYQNLAQLTGAVFCKYADADAVAPLLHYVVCELKASRHAALLVLHELVKQVCVARLMLVGRVVVVGRVEPEEEDDFSRFSFSFVRDFCQIFIIVEI